MGERLWFVISRLYSQFSSQIKKFYFVHLGYHPTLQVCPVLKPIVFPSVHPFFIHGFPALQADCAASYTVDCRSLNYTDQSFFVRWQIFFPYTTCAKLMNVHVPAWPVPVFCEQKLEDVRLQAFSDLWYCMC